MIDIVAAKIKCFVEVHFGHLLSHIWISKVRFTQLQLFPVPVAITPMFRANFTVVRDKY